METKSVIYNHPTTLLNLLLFLAINLLILLALAPELGFEQPTGMKEIFDAVAAIKYAMERLILSVLIGLALLILLTGAAIAWKPLLDAKENSGPWFNKFVEDWTLVPEKRDDLKAKAAADSNAINERESTIKRMNDDNNSIVNTIQDVEGRILERGGQVPNPQGRRDRIVPAHIRHSDRYAGLSQSAWVRLIKGQNKEILGLQNGLSRLAKAHRVTKEAVRRLEAEKMQLEKLLDKRHEMAKKLAKGQKATVPRDDRTNKVQHVRCAGFMNRKWPKKETAVARSVVGPVVPVTPVADRAEGAALEAPPAPRRRRHANPSRARSCSPAGEPAPVRQRSPASARRPRPGPEPTSTPSSVAVASPPVLPAAQEPQDVDMEDAPPVDPDSMDYEYQSEEEMNELAEEMDGMTIVCNAMVVDSEPSLLNEMEVDTASASTTSQGVTGSSILAAAAAAAPPVMSTALVPVQQPAPIAMLIPGIGAPAAPAPMLPVVVNTQPAAPIALAPAPPQVAASAPVPMPAPLAPAVPVPAPVPAPTTLPGPVAIAALAPSAPAPVPVTVPALAPTILPATVTVPAALPGPVPVTAPAPSAPAASAPAPTVLIPSAPATKRPAAESDSDSEDDARPAKKNTTASKAPEPMPTPETATTTTIASSSTPPAPAPAATYADDDDDDDDDDVDPMAPECERSPARPVALEHVFAVAEEARNKAVTKQLREANISDAHIKAWEVRHRVRLEAKIKELMKQKKRSPYSRLDALNLIDGEIEEVWGARIGREKGSDHARTARDIRRLYIDNLLRQKAKMPTVLVPVKH